MNSANGLVHCDTVTGRWITGTLMCMEEEGCMEEEEIIRGAQTIARVLRVLTFCIALALAAFGVWKWVRFA